MSEVTTFGAITEDQFIQEAQRNEGFGKDESIIPFTRILQPLSPQVSDTAQPGMFLNFANNRITDGKQGLIFAPVFHQWNYTEWTPRSEGGGFIADYGESESWKEKCDLSNRNAYQPITKDGTVILKARHFYIFQLIIEDDMLIVEPSIYPFAGTGLKVARTFSAMLQNAPKIPTSKGPVVPAHFYYVYKMVAKEFKNTKGRWFLPEITRQIDDLGKAVSILSYENGQEIWKQAIEFREAFQAGKIKAASQDTMEHGNEEDSPM